MSVYLNTIQIGQEAKVLSVSGINTALRRRLLDMGLTPNTIVKVERFAPLGDPMELSVRGYSLTMRKEDAKLIEVEVIG